MLNKIDLSRIDLNLLVLFDTVLRERNVGRAAAALNLTPSAVSHGLGRMRLMLGDPLFLRMPRGMAPTDRALALADPVADILARIRQVVTTAVPFDPAASTRRFMLGVPDAAAAVLIGPLLRDLGCSAPGIDIGLRQLLPAARLPGPSGAGPWDEVFGDLDARSIDIAVLPVAAGPARFALRPVFEERFVVVSRAGHAFAAAPTLDAFCAANHLLVSLNGDRTGFVDLALAAQGRSRRVALTLPSFTMAPPVLADSDLIAALPSRFAAAVADRHGLAVTEFPLVGRTDALMAVTPRVALMDDGLAWLLDRLCAAGKGL
jgi:DNA-binding transcriptional LysR family regulator